MEIVKGKRTKRTRQRPYFPIPSPQMISTDEEKDMANCLILLAQGFFPKQETKEKEEKYNKRGKMTGYSGFDIYNCKTCDQTFQSFQALGGHRASHKKPRIDPREDPKVKIEDVKGQLNNFLPLAIKRSKVHECPVCGSKFNSGQALGGHMRRHRAQPKRLKDGDKGICFLAFDLNLPALTEDDRGHLIEPEFGVEEENHVNFSGPALIDCHY